MSRSIPTISASMTRWSVNSCSWRDASRLSQELCIPHTAAMVLAGRGFTDAQTAREFIECSAPLPDPFLFADMPEAVQKIIDAIDAGSKIVVHGDYDADGITATAVMMKGLQQLGAQVDWYLPSRFKEGYGVSRTAVESIAADEAKLLITVDCGINYPDEIALASELGVEVIVVDHHEPGSRVPDCCLIHHSRGVYPHGDLCGVGLALKVLHGVHVVRLEADAGKLPEEMAALLDLVAIGTIADLSSLRGENRYYVREGLRLMNLGKRVGLRALCEVSSCTGAVDSGAVAFRIAPRLNAAGRLADPNPPLRLLLTEDEVEAKRLAGELHELNGARQDLERAMFESARLRVESLEILPSVVVLADPEWHEGVVGIVASRLVEEFHRPTVLLRVRDGVAKGSGRSVPAYDLLSGITQCAELLSVFGGHAQAAGLTLDAERVDEFREALNAHASSALSAADLMPRYRADAVLTAQDLGVDTARALSAMEPFGSGNARPRLLMVDARLRQMQPTRNGLHLRGVADIGGVNVPVIGFGLGRGQHEEVTDETPCVAGVQLRADEWRGALRTQLVLEKVSTSLGGDSEPEDEQPGPVDLGIRGALTASDDGIARHEAERPGQKGRRAEWPLSVRDIRGCRGPMTELAQILTTREPTLALVGSRARTLAALRERLPAFLFGATVLDSIAARAALGASGSVDEFGVALVEWANIGEAERFANTGALLPSGNSMNPREYCQSP